MQKLFFVYVKNRKILQKLCTSHGDTEEATQNLACAASVRRAGEAQNHVCDDGLSGIQEGRWGDEKRKEKETDKPRRSLHKESSSRLRSRLRRASEHASNALWQRRHKISRVPLFSTPLLSHIRSLDDSICFNFYTPFCLYIFATLSRHFLIVICPSLPLETRRLLYLVSSSFTISRTCHHVRVQAR